MSKDSCENTAFLIRCVVKCCSCTSPVSGLTVNILLSVSKSEQMISVVIANCQRSRPEFLRVKIVTSVYYNQQWHLHANLIDFVLSCDFFCLIYLHT